MEVGGKETLNFEERKLEELSKDNLKQIILEMSDFLSGEQSQKLEALIEQSMRDNVEPERIRAAVRMSQEVADEKMNQIEVWMNQIDDGELYLDTEEYEDYSSGYWDSDWITDYYDNQGIGDKILAAIRFAKNCVDDGRYQEANFIYEWLWEMCVYGDNEDCDSADLEMLVEKGIVHTDIRQLALLTLYADYQAKEPDKRAEDIYLYFRINSFQKLHIEDMFHAGLENLTGTEQFLKDWIELLKTKTGETEGRLLKEAVLYHEGIDGLVKMADENCQTHPSLYLAAMKEYDKNRDYNQIEKIGEKSLEKIDSRLIIRSETALKAAYASSCLMHQEKMMRFCFEAFRSDSTDRNFLRLFGTEEMAKQYGMRGKEVLTDRMKGRMAEYVRNAELRQNVIGDYGYYTLSFYTGDFETVKDASKNPAGSLGWSSRFICYGIRFILLYLYENPMPSMAAAAVADYVGFGDVKDSDFMLDFENEIMEESRRNKTSLFWSYFKRWKPYFPMAKQEQEKYLSWAEKIVYKRADAIVSGQHRNHYYEVAALLAIVAEIKENMKLQGAKREIFAEYKRKFPRHSSFQAEMRSYFGF